MRVGRQFGYDCIGSAYNFTLADGSRMGRVFGGLYVCLPV